MSDLSPELQALVTAARCVARRTAGRALVDAVRELREAVDAYNESLKPKPITAYVLRVDFDTSTLLHQRPWPVTCWEVQVTPIRKIQRDDAAS